jgi:hypothetical protein
MQRVITLNPPQSIVDSFTGHVEELALHPYGCRVLQKVFECLPEKMKRTLLEEMHKCTYKLIEDQFGSTSPRQFQLDESANAVRLRHSERDHLRRREGPGKSARQDEGADCPPCVNDANGFRTS